MSRPPETHPDDKAIRQAPRPTAEQGKDQAGDKPESHSLNKIDQSESSFLDHGNRSRISRSSGDHDTIGGRRSNSKRSSNDGQQLIEQSIKDYEAVRQAQTLPLLMTAQHLTETKPQSSGDNLTQLSRPSSKSASTRGEGADSPLPSEFDVVSVDKQGPRAEKLNSTLLMKKLQGVKGKTSKLASRSKPESNHLNQESRSKESLLLGQIQGRSSSQETSSKPKEGSYFPDNVAMQYRAPEHSTMTDKPPAIIPRSSTLHMPMKGSPLKSMISPLVSPPGQPEKVSPASNNVGDPNVQELRPDLEAYRDALKDSTALTPENSTMSAAGGLEEPLVKTDEDQPILENELPNIPQTKQEDLAFELPSTPNTQVAQNENEAAVEKAIETAPQETTEEPIASNQVMTSADILAGRLPSMQNISDDAVPSETEDTDTPAALTQAERDFMEEEIQEENLDALVPAPKVITSQDIRKRRYDYTDFPHTLKSAVPRVETHPGAINSATTGEIVPFADEQIHLDAGETLVDGTGRTWNKEGVVEPGKDLEGRFLVYEVDLNQVRKTYGSVPAILTWVSLSGERNR